MNKDLEILLIECKNELYNYIKNYRDLVFRDSKQWNYWHSTRQLIAIMNKYWKDSNIFKESILHLISICIYKEYNTDVSFIKSFRKEWMSINLIRDYFSDCWNKTVERWFKTLLKQFSFKYFYFDNTWHEQLVHNLFMYFIYMKYEELSKTKDFNDDIKNDSEFFKSFMWDLEWEEIEKVDDVKIDFNENTVVFKEEKQANDTNFIDFDKSSLKKFITKQDEDIIEKRNQQRKQEKREISINKHIEDIINEKKKLSSNEIREILESIKEDYEKWKHLEEIRLKFKEILSIMKNNFEKIDEEFLRIYIRKSMETNINEYWFLKQWWNVEFLLNKLIRLVGSQENNDLLSSILLWIYYTLDFDWEIIK